MPTQEEIDKLYQQGLGIQQGIDTAKQMADTLSVQQGSAPTDVSVITGESISASTPKTDFKKSEELPIIPPPEILPATTYEATPKETELSDLIKQLTETSGLPGEKEAFRVEQEKAAGLETMRQAEADYTAQLTQLSADWKNVENRMQLAAEGRGITAGGLAPLTMAEQRRISIRANTVGALLAATQGKITFAQSQVDRAVNAKYAQQEADRKAKLENLELLSRDPTLTVEQQQRANAQTVKLKKEGEAEDKKKDDSTTIMKWAVLAAQNGATPQQAQEISKIAMSDNPDLLKAIALAQPFMAKKEEDKLLSVAEAKSLRVAYGTTEKQAVAMGIVPGVEPIGGELEEKLSVSDAAVRNWILDNKRANPDIPYYDLWGQLADEMRNQELNPANYDKIFWEILHPEGEAGYQKYVKGAGEGKEIENPFK